MYSLSVKRNKIVFNTKFLASIIKSEKRRKLVSATEMITLKGKILRLVTRHKSNKGVTKHILVKSNVSVT